MPVLGCLLKWDECVYHHAFHLAENSACLCIYIMVQGAKPDWPFMHVNRIPRLAPASNGQLCQYFPARRKWNVLPTIQITVGLTLII
ncbi:rCG55348 [Rattus norvegicus]|uniref:RCG55348 n=1 Tax=Rattus norvegicus TaxID=10116 RepID=A6KF26_RAT|nr:rCG55348 [Rattus norvegicus]